MNQPQASVSHPSHDEFAALLEESLTTTALQEGNVVKGTIVGIEKDVAVIDVGLKTEGRVPLKEFGVTGRSSDLSVGDQVDVYLERVENAMGEAVLSRDTLMDLVRGEALEAFDRSIDVHVSRIRVAIEDDPKRPRRLLTVRGAGYVFARQQD